MAKEVGNQDKGMYFLDESFDELQRKWEEDHPHEEWMQALRRYAAKHLSSQQPQEEEPKIQGE